MAKKVKVTAEKIKRRDTIIERIIKTIFFLFLALSVLFLILTFIYKGGAFTITLDPNLMLKSGLIMFENMEEENSKPKLYAKGIDFMDNISIKWIPEKIYEEAEGSHNGENYIAYTFYLKNNGEKTVNYWYEVTIDEVIKNVDEAVRIMIYHNNEKKVYAKRSNITKEAEVGTTMFYSDKIAVLEERVGLEPEKVDKITIVIWIEGDDPDCVDSIIGGEIKANMNIVEKHIVEEGKNNEK